MGVYVYPLVYPRAKSSKNERFKGGSGGRFHFSSVLGAPKINPVEPSVLGAPNIDAAAVFPSVLGAPNIDAAAVFPSVLGAPKIDAAAAFPSAAGVSKMDPEEAPDRVPKMDAFPEVPKIDPPLGGGAIKLEDAPPPSAAPGPASPSPSSNISFSSPHASAFA